MKIAVPTNDGIHIAPDLESAKGCMVISLVFSEIVNQDIRWKEDARTGSMASFPEIAECNCIMLRSKTDPSLHLPRMKDLSVIRTSDELITNAIVHYLEHEHLAASNTCCCP
jgi:hypothetical protein